MTTRSRYQTAFRKSESRPKAPKAPKAPFLGWLHLVVMPLVEVHPSSKVSLDKCSHQGSAHWHQSLARCALHPGVICPQGWRSRHRAPATPRSSSWPPRRTLGRIPSKSPPFSSSFAVPRARKGGLQARPSHQKALASRSLPELGSPICLLPQHNSLRVVRQK